MKTRIFLLSLFIFSFFVGKTQNLTVIVKDSITQEALPGVSVAVLNSGLGGNTDAQGKIIFTKALDGKYEVKLRLIGYKAKTASVEIPLDTLFAVLLAPEENAIEEVTISATRTNARMEDSPMKVEILGGEEMNEENNIKPGNITSLLGDISGIQIQQSSAVSGNANVRIQGLGGKYTQIMRDGIPLYEGFSGSFGIMQVPPLDLKQ